MIPVFLRLVFAVVLMIIAQPTTVYAQPFSPMSISSPNGPELFVEVKNVVHVYNAEFHEITMFRLPYSGRITTDRLGNVYVGYERHGLVQVFKPPYTGTPIDLKIYEKETGPLEVTGIAIDGHTGLLAVSSSGNNFMGGPGGVSFFRSGETHPCNFIRGGIDTISFDATGVLFYAGSNVGQGYLGTITGGCQATQAVPSANLQQPFPFNMTVDAQNDIAFVNCFNKKGECVLSTYAHPINNSYGSPIASTSVGNTYRCTTDSLASDGAHLWTACTGYHAPGILREIAYPGGGTPIRILPFAQGFPHFATVFPPVVPGAQIRP